MGSRTLIEINHDSFSDVYGDKLIEDLNRYVRSGSREDAQRLQNAHGVRVISTRSTGDAYHVSDKTDGFPTRLPHDEKLDRQNREWASAVEKAKGVIGGTIRVRTMAGLRDIIVKLLANIKN